ncbi:MAG: aspartate/glutamate racemase family protein [Synergistaceae bacterium]|jgi:Asp/Glu/hydantoin racemase|nr:aspartate/glutamate racemase family protein [Synergistaceae bacterium]
MGKKQIGLIRVLTTENKELLNLHGKMLMNWFPELEVVSNCIPNQPDGVHDDETEKAAIPKVLELAQKMESDGMGAVVVSCAGDPGVELATKKLAIPVIGAGRAAAAMARVLERPVGVLGITEKVPSAILQTLGSCFKADAIPRGVVSTLDLMKPEGMAVTIEAGRELMERGAKVLLLACTGMSTIGAALRLREALGVPVVDPVRAEAAVVRLVVS